MIKDRTIRLRDGGCPHCSPIRSLYLINNIIYYNEPGIGYVVLDQEAKYGFRICVQVHDVRDPEVLQIPGQSEWPMGGALESEMDVDFIIEEGWQFRTGKGIPEDTKAAIIKKLASQFNM
jgi:hypothetical protein